MPGGHKEVVDDNEILEIFVQSDNPVLFTTEVADKTGFSNETRLRLRESEDEGFLASKTGGGKIPVWWITEQRLAELQEE